MSEETFEVELIHEGIMPRARALPLQRRLKLRKVLLYLRLN